MSAHPSDVNRPRRRLRGAERRTRIEAAAVDVFARRGYDATSIGEVALAAGVTRTVLYDHFHDKRDLFLHVLETQHELMLSEIAGGITSEGEPRDRVRATLAAYLRFTRDHPSARRLLLDPVPSGDIDLDEVVRGYLEARSDAISGLLATDLARAGVDLSSTSLPVIVAVMSGASDGLAQWWALHPETPFDDVVDAATRLLWNGLPRAGEP
ncbi:TetR/AcrR family transcriptional regulator [Nocardioides stalactiti]|uniref:TetR/AcrR family transcriptional regulator n=1 Tax=Nocardioides stalactiti TaxID=2755356 RepID=UPI0015FF444B|nr:TetR/AcrR family transcriptional regulator [Nocardioides stalactiti]